MLLGGLWHGASWTFVVWGGLHGIYLMVERFLRQHLGKSREPSSNNFVVAMLVYLLVDITWVFFRAQDFGTAWRLIRSMFGFGVDVQATLPTIYIVETVITMVLLIGTHWFMRHKTIEQVVQKTPWWLVGLTWAVMLFLIIITQGSGSAFIYFQF
jgi:alginate O-acetyltransferase complex protein AlgI